MASLHIPSPGEAPGVYPIARRGERLKHLSFTVVELGESLREHSLVSGEEELSLDFYTGPVRVEVEGSFGRWSADVGPRASIREAAPMIYAPAGSKLRLSCLDGPARITIAGALGKPGGGPALVAGERIMRKDVGRDNWSRLVLTHIADNIDAARLIAGETVSAGGWSSFPPHKHDCFALPSECPMEEIYYFQVDPPQGFGFMRVYTAPDDPERIDESYAVQHGDTVLIPRGYHPVAACPGYTLNYTWVLAGEGRTYGAWRDDPRHVWIRERS
jgi:5-deoxy-glucuronate isomerase